jgi:dTDP-4-dehydrorhamnose 3,5-epimerase
MHFQSTPHEEAKVVTCLKGGVFDVIVDLRPGSPTFLAWEGVELTEGNKRRLYIPKGFAHGFQTLIDDTELLYLISEFYVPEAGNGVGYDDPAFGIKWPLPVSSISEKDLGWQGFMG